MADTKTVTVTSAQERFTSWASDVLVYTVVLNLFVEYSDAIVIDSFTISLFTAAVLKVLLDLLTVTEHHVSQFFGRVHKALGFLSMWAVLFLSKFVILEVIDLIFGEHVELGKFLDVVLLIVAMMVARELVNRVYDRLGYARDPARDWSPLPDVHLLAFAKRLAAEGMGLIAQIRQIYDNYDIETEILAASIRHPMHMVESMLQGADCGTLPPKVLYQLLKHPLTDRGLEAFLADWETLGKDL